MYINNLGHMTKMAAMPIYGKNPSKIIFSETNRLISRKLGVRHRWLKYSNVYINHDPVMTLTKFMARSAWVACASELGKLLKCHLKEKANRKLANGQNIEDSEKRKWPKGLSAPALELNTIIFKHFYWYMQLISGERLQDHWSSGSETVQEGLCRTWSEPNLFSVILFYNRKDLFSFFLQPVQYFLALSSDIRCSLAVMRLRRFADSCILEETASLKDFQYGENKSFQHSLHK